jgi:hypothetical protein
MKRLLVLLVVLIVALGALAVYASTGPAPNSGDGVSDGSGLPMQPGPAGDGDPFGPADNSGDGVSDGSGMEAPYSGA